MSILKTAFFKKVEQYFKIEPYGRDTNKAGRKRARIELLPMPDDVKAEALRFTMPCVDCGEPIHPFRAREHSGRGNPGHMYYAPTCPLDVCIRCSRGGAARDEYKAVRAHFGK